MLTIFIFAFWGCGSSDKTSAPRNKENPEVSTSAALDATWELNYIRHNKQSFTDLFPDQKPFIKFDTKNNSASGSSGCNSFSCSYSIDDNKMKISENIMTTEMLCIEGMNGEKAFLNTLKKVDSYSISSSGNTLYLKKDGITSMKLRKSAR